MNLLAKDWHIFETANTLREAMQVSIHSLAMISSQFRLQQQKTIWIWLDIKKSSLYAVMDPTRDVGGIFVKITIKSYLK